jgi:hypothetical protein
MVGWWNRLKTIWDNDPFIKPRADNKRRFQPTSCLDCRMQYKIDPYSYVSPCPDTEKSGVLFCHRISHDLAIHAMHESQINLHLRGKHLPRALSQLLHAFDLKK